MEWRTLTGLWHASRPSALGLACLVLLPLIAGCGFDAYYFFVPASRAPCDSIPNGCGPEGATGLLVPDCPFGVVCFKFACDRHDLCYAGCGGPRDSCDSNFGKDMLGLCAADYVAGDPRFDKCLTLAFIYWQAAGPAITPPYEDVDDDLLPDAWERATGCDPTARDALVDMDGDGFNNLEEFVHGTDPCDATSVPVMKGR